LNKKKGCIVAIWTNDAAISQWGAIPRAVLDAMEPDGDFAKRHLLNSVVLRMLGNLHGRRVLDAGCGQGYFSRMLADRGAEVVGVEPGQSLIAYAVEREAQRGQGIRYVQADLCGQPDLGGPFDAVVTNMVLMSVPEWKAAMKQCVAVLAPGGRFVFSIVHPCFEQLAPSWREHGEYRAQEYLADYEINGPYAPDFHRPLSAYLNELIHLGCQLREVAEPGLDREIATAGQDGADAYRHFPNFVIVSADHP
jgi:2-polyprenyl-3-methyl-5-hydroxy-6-metoxy-1,4-benzoquinol methylase